MTDREAMQQALEHLDRVMSHGSAVQEAKDILREQLTQPKQEPVAWAHKEGLEAIKDFDASIYANGGFDDAVPLYTTPPQRKPLTDDEADELVRRYARYELIRAIEAAHGIKGEA